MDVLWQRGTGVHWHSTALSITKKLKSGLDMDVSGIKLCGTLIGIKRIIDLIVAGFVLFKE
jgi:hypothetical protein